MNLMNQQLHLGVETDRLQPYAPYGKACLNCTKTKTRCAVATAEGKCERCCRLKKDCQPSPSVRKKRVSKRPTATSSKTAALEEKLEGLVQMLQRSQTSIPGAIAPLVHVRNHRDRSREQNMCSVESYDSSKPSQHDRNSQENPGYSDFIAENALSPTKPCTLDELAQQTGLTNTSKAAQKSQQALSSRLTSHAGPPTPAASVTSCSIRIDKHHTFADYPPETEIELEENLECYRTKMVPHLPIVCVDPNTTAKEMRKHRPFLFLVIRAICSKNLQRQVALVLEIKKIIGSEMLIEGSKNMDLFLGILAFAGWCHLYICNRPITSTVIHLAMSLAFDLGLTKPLPSESSSVMLNWTAQGCPRPTNSMIPIRTMEERRGLVGLYLVSSVCANYFQRIDLMRWTRYLDECLCLLEDKKEYLTDELLVYLTRVQLICNKGSSTTINHPFCDAEIAAPADFYVKTLKAQLDSVEQSIPPELKSNATLQLHILNTTLTIHERILIYKPKISSSDPTEKLECIESLWICFTAVKSWFNTFFSLEVFPLSVYTHFSMVPLTQIAHCLVVLFRLSTFDNPDIPWDRQRIRQEMDFGDIVQLIFDRWEQVPEANGIEIVTGRLEVTEDSYESEQPWFHSMKKILLLKSLWEAKVAAMTAMDASEIPGDLQTDSNVNLNGVWVPGTQMMDTLEFGPMNMDMLDDTWIRDILGGYDFNA